MRPKDQLQSHRSTRPITQPAVVRIIFSPWTVWRSEWSNPLCKICSKKSQNDVSFIWFADKNLFTLSTLETWQNYRLYAPATTKQKDVGAKRIFRTRTTLSQSLMVTACGIRLHRFNASRSQSWLKSVIVPDSVTTVASAIRHVSGEFSKQCRGSFLTKLFHKVSLATFSRCSWIFNNRFIANFLQNDVPVKELWKSVNMW